jgi:mono/diheme cytochrome c family protein
MSSRFRTRGGALAIAALIAVVAMMPLMGQAQDATPQASPAASNALLSEGEQIFNSVCIACHQPGGKGVAGIFPALNGNPLITQEDPTYPITTVLNGRGGMPRFAGTYDNEQIAAVLTYVRQAWDNDAGPVSPDQVEAIRNPETAATPEVTPTPDGQIPSDAAAESSEGTPTSEGTPGN